MAFGLDGALGQGLNFNSSAQQDASTINNSMMGDIQQTTAMQMKMQTEMGQLSMISKLNEAMAKIFKAIGEAVKGLAG